MDFIKGLPSSKGRDTILVAVDRLTKYGHFLALVHPDSTSFIATAFLDNVYKLHILPDAIIYDRDRMLNNSFW